MEITELAECIKSLTESERVQLNDLLVGHSQLVVQCPQGERWNGSQCVPNV